MKFFKKRLAGLIAALFLFIFVGSPLVACSFSKSDEVKYSENYLVNFATPTDSHKYEEFKYDNQKDYDGNYVNRKPIYMGGHEYYGGFTITNTVGPYKAGFATFELDGSYKEMAFVMGVADARLSNIEYHTLISVYVDGKQVVDEGFLAYDVPRRYTIDITGAKQVSFKMLEGYLKIGVAECTVWKDKGRLR